MPLQCSMINIKTFNLLILHCQSIEIIWITSTQHFIFRFSLRIRDANEELGYVCYITFLGISRNLTWPDTNKYRSHILRSGSLDTHCCTHTHTTCVHRNTHTMARCLLYFLRYAPLLYRHFFIFWREIIQSLSPYLAVYIGSPTLIKFCWS